MSRHFFRLLHRFSCLLSPEYVDNRFCITRNARRSLMTERSERMSEEASFHLYWHHARSHGAAFEQRTENSSEYGQVQGQSLLLLEKLNELDLDAEAELCEKLHEDAEHLFHLLLSRIDDNSTTDDV